MRFTKALSCGTLALALAVGGCGDSTGTNTVTMTQAEASEVFSEVFDALVGGGVNFQQSGPLFSRVGVPNLSSMGALGSIDVTANCTPSGTVHVSGTSTEGTTTSFDITETFASCTTPHFVLTGALTFAGSGSATSGSFTIKGGIDITGSKSGHCVFDLTFTFSGQSGTVAGTVCGADFSGTA